MHFTFLPLALAAVPFVYAQYNYGNSPASSGSSAASPAASSPPSGTSSGSSSTHTVEVGNGGLTFNPNSITAAVGDTIEYHFFPPLHSVAQSSFDSPCTPINSSAFFSGGISTSSGTNTNVFSLTINDTNPIWFYCGVPTHCETGMSGVINQASGSPNTLQAYQAAAAKVGSTVAPSTVQGGILGPVQAVTNPSGSSTSSGAGASSTASTKSAGVEARGGIQWLLLAVTGVVAVGFGRLIV